MGEFAMLDIFQSLDLKVSPDSSEYRTSYFLMIFTWFVYIMGFFILTMVFMNFLIAVIGDTYSNVIEYKVAHDYQ